MEQALTSIETASDRELIELAAMAAAIEVEFGTLTSKRGDVCDGAWLRDSLDEWNPLADDGDAFRLAMHLGMLVEVSDDRNEVCAAAPTGHHWTELCEGSPCAAAREAITRCAAAIALTMKAA